MPPAPTKTAKSRPARRLSYLEQRDLDGLPGRLDALHGELAGLERDLADPTLYGRDAGRFEALTARLSQCRDALATAEERWLDLEMKREDLERGT